MNSPKEKGLQVINLQAQFPDEDHSALSNRVRSGPSSRRLRSGGVYGATMPKNNDPRKWSVNHTAGITWSSPYAEDGSHALYAAASASSSTEINSRTTVDMPSSGVKVSTFGPSVVLVRVRPSS